VISRSRPDLALTETLEDQLTGAGRVGLAAGGLHDAAGALVGAVMKATRGQADAARARELILQRLGQG